MMSDDLTVHILTEIRDELRGVRDAVRETNHRVDATNQRLDAANQRLDVTNQRLDGLADTTNRRYDETNQRLLEAEPRLATRFVELTASNRDIHKLLEDRFDLRDRVERVEQDVAELKKTGPKS